MRIFLTILALMFGASVAVAGDLAPQSLKPGAAATTVTITNDRNPFAGAYVGVELGGQFTALRILGEDVAAGDGVTYGGVAGYNFSSGRIVFGPYVRGGFADVDIHDELKMRDYVQTGALIGYQIGADSLVSVRLGYEWQSWELGPLDIDAGGMVIAGGLETLLAPQVSLGLNVDYVMLGDSVEAGGVDISRFTDDSDAFRITVGLTYRPEVALPKLF